MQELELKLLPRYIKLVALSLLPVTALILLVMGKLGLGQFAGAEVFTALKSIALLSALLFIMAKDKVENSLTKQLRLHAMATAFMFAIMYFSIQPFIRLAFDGVFAFWKDFGIFQLFLVIIFVYLGIFYFSKWKYRIYSIPRRRKNGV